MTTSLPPKPDAMHIEEDGDLVVVRHVGAFDFAAAQYMQARRAQVAERYGYHLMLFDARASTVVLPNTRKFLFDMKTSIRTPSATAVMGASFAAMTLARMMIRASNLLRQDRILCDFFVAEPEARAYLVTQREELRRMIEGRP